MDLLASYGEEAKVVLPELREARVYYAENTGPGKTIPHPEWAVLKFLEGFDAGIRKIEESKGSPQDLRDLPQ